MRDVVLEIDGERHRLCVIEADEVSCGQCSLKRYCLNQKENAILYCEKLASLFDDENARKYCLHFKLDRDERREN